jgi:hypothetical protein
MSNPTITRKGYELSQDQQARYDALIPFTRSGPGYRRGVAANLNRITRCEGSWDVDLRLADAEAHAAGTVQF